jgi:small-conductance mechanosensitive channel
MTYSGRNFDILTGITAALLGAWLLRRPAPRWVIGAWNVLGLVLLANVVTIAVLSTPLFAAFGPDRVLTLVTYPPFIWLPAVLVLAALMGHILVWRCLSNARFTRGFR